jgi:WD40 repeat protein
MTTPIMSLGVHNYAVNSVAVSPDGTRIVSGSNDKMVRLWDAETGQHIRGFCRPGWDCYTGCIWNKGLTTHDDVVNSVAFSPDGTKIASGSNDRTICVWDVQTGQLILRLIYTYKVTSLVFSPDGKKIVSGNTANTIHLLDAETGQFICIFTGHTASVMSVAISPDGTKIVSGSKDKNIRLWNAETGECIRRLVCHFHYVNSVAFSPDGDMILSGSGDRTVRLWNASTGQLIQTLYDHTNGVYSVAFSPDGSMIVSGSGDKTIRVWDAKTGKSIHTLIGRIEKVFQEWGPYQPIRTVRTSHVEEVLSVAFSPDGNKIVSGDMDHYIHIFMPNLLLENGARTKKALREEKQLMDDEQKDDDIDTSGSLPDVSIPCKSSTEIKDEQQYEQKKTFPKPVDIDNDSF